VQEALTAELTYQAHLDARKPVTGPGSSPPVDTWHQRVDSTCSTSQCISQLDTQRPRLDQLIGGNGLAAFVESAGQPA
jgi:hypothetical protein